MDKISMFFKKTGFWELMTIIGIAMIITMVFITYDLSNEQVDVLANTVIIISATLSIVSSLQAASIYYDEEKQKKLDSQIKSSYKEVLFAVETNTSLLDKQRVIALKNLRCLRDKGEIEPDTPEKPLP